MPHAKYSFYIPHERVTFSNELVDLATGEVTYPPSMTKQSFVAECDINNIIKSFKITGQIQHMSAKAAAGAYMDLPDNLDYQDALNTVIQAEQSFASLPAKVRDRFGNDPEQFLAFMADPANQDEIIKLGLATDTRPPEQPPAQTPPTPSKTPDPGPTG